MPIDSNSITYDLNQTQMWKRAFYAVLLNYYETAEKKKFEKEGREA